MYNDLECKKNSSELFDVLKISKNMLTVRPVTSSWIRATSRNVTLVMYGVLGM